MPKEKDLVLQKSLELHDRLIKALKKFYLSEMMDKVDSLDATNITMAAIASFIPHAVANLFNRDVPATIINGFIDKICDQAKSGVEDYKKFIGRLND